MGDHRNLPEHVWHAFLDLDGHKSSDIVITAWSIMDGGADGDCTVSRHLVSIDGVSKQVIIRVRTRDNMLTHYRMLAPTANASGAYCKLCSIKT